MFWDVLYESRFFQLLVYLFETLFSSVLGLPSIPEACPL